MTRLDLLTNFVNELEHKTNLLIGCVEDSNKIIFNISNLNQEITEADFNLESIVDSYGENYAFLNRSQGLHEKLFYLESSLHINDTITNQNSYNNLLKEYQALTQNLIKSTGIYGEEYKEDITDNHEHEYTPETSTPSLNHPISISNLKLKPIRCKSTKIYKKKSRYRLSNIYNLNPIAYDEWSSCDDSHESIEVAPRKVSENTNSSSTTNIMDNGNSNDYDTSLTNSSNASIDGNDNAKGGNNVTDSKDYDLNSLELFQYSNSIHDTNEMIKNDSPIGSSMPNEVAFVDQQQEVNLDMEPEYDAISICSDLSDFSPSRRRYHNDNVNSDDDNITDNFERYLRESRIDLSNTFPHIVKKAKSHDSIFLYKSTKSEEKPSFKFHNPIDKIQVMAKPSKPTIESIFSNKTSSISSSTSANSRKILNEVILKNVNKESKSAESPLSKSFKTNFSIFNFSGSPKVTGKKMDIENRRYSIENLGPTLTDSLLNLVQSPKKKGNSLKTLKPKKVSREKLLIPKKNPQELPIRVKNETQMKRLPIRVPQINGYHSNLYIGPNNTTIINHGESSVFRKPIMSPIRHNTLKDALSQSLI